MIASVWFAMAAFAGSEVTRGYIAVVAGCLIVGVDMVLTPAIDSS